MYTTCSYYSGYEPRRGHCQDPGSPACATHSSNTFSDAEINLNNEFGTKMIEYTEKEIAGMFGALIQMMFTPDLETLC